MNNVVVAKFGGSSLADSNQFKKVKIIVESDIKRKYIIPSAPGKRNNSDYKITDLLYLLQNQVQQGIPAVEVYSIIKDRFVNLVEELKVDVDIVAHLEEIRSNIINGASADYAASRGEYLNGIILAKYLDAQFIDAAEVICFDNFESYDSEKTIIKLKERLQGAQKAVIPGFYGAKPNGEIKTFSRGGSDVTGAIVAGALEVDLYENWTDVSGFLMADPRIIDNPKPIEKLTYRELRELSYMGASVLHEEAIFPVRKAGIPINIKNTNRPQDIGTFIVSDNETFISKTDVTGIAGKKDFTVIAIEKTLMNSEKGFCRKVLSILEQYDVPFEHMPSGIDTVSLIIEDVYLKNTLGKILKDINRQCDADVVDVHPNMALISTVGNGMAYKKGMAARIFDVLAKSGINVRMINQGSSEINITVGIENEDFEKALKCIYDEFK